LFQDVEYRVQSTFPTPIDKWALKEAQGALDRGKKKSVLLLPVDKIHSLLQKVARYAVESGVVLTVTFAGAAAVQGRLDRLALSSRRSGIHFGRYFETGRELREEHQTFRDHVPRCTDIDERRQGMQISRVPIASVRFRIGLGTYIFRCFFLF
jgi:hypothetical protein